jgi:hypothetical protein
MGNKTKFAALYYTAKIGDTLEITQQDLWGSPVGVDTDLWNSAEPSSNYNEEIEYQGREFVVSDFDTGFGKNKEKWIKVSYTDAAGVPQYSTLTVETLSFFYISIVKKKVSSFQELCLKIQNKYRKNNG